MASDTWQRHRTTETNDSEGHRKMEDGVMITAEETREDDKGIGGDAGLWGYQTRVAVDKCSGG